MAALRAHIGDGQGQGQGLWGPQRVSSVLGLREGARQREAGADPACPRFTREEPEAQREVTCPGSRGGPHRGLWTSSPELPLQIQGCQA